ncbi:MAG: hypothetical protein H7Z72_04320 [Bacteroidetes bacterium]|nr:hypothetical protein [Fibrella sp.]
MKLRDTLLLSAALGCFILWVMEFRRGSFADSYWLLLTSLGFLLTFQFFRVKQREAARALSPTVKQMIEDRQQKKGPQPVTQGPAETAPAKDHQAKEGRPVGRVQPSASGKKRK